MENQSKSNNNNSKTAYFGGGCFWCTEAVFLHTKGVVQVEPGYAGGEVANPTYEQVCTGETGHAEVAKITFDPEVIGFNNLLGIFFSTHNPTTPNRQGSDIGTQYRSIILYNNEGQKKAAEETIKELEKQNIFGKSVVTQIVPLIQFYPAEDYHKNYFQRNQDKPYCQIVIAPKLAKFREKYNKFYK